MDFYAVIAYSVGGALLLLTSIGIILSIFMPALDKWNKRYLALLFALQLICIITCFADAVLYSFPEFAFAEIIFINLGFFFLAPLMVMPTIFLLHHSDGSIRKSLFFKAVIGLILAYLIMLIVAQFTDVFFYSSPDEVFVRGPLFPLFISPMAAIMLLDIVVLLFRRKKLLLRYRIAFWLYIPPMLLVITLHMFIFIEFYVLLCIGLWAIAIMALVISNNVGEYMRQQQEIAQQKASIMVLQMRPHFIYNTMMSIYYLCDQDPMKAKQVTLDFTTYLRKNFAAIASEKMIPFAEELEHTRAYLAVEQAQFEETLFVTFDTPHTLFHLPSLTLQPIVENAVKHGMRESKEAIHIYVSTRKTEDKTVIVVEDDGPGYKPTDDNEPHIALANLRGRLELMCHGNLEISAREGGGTRVTITLPLLEEVD